MVRVAAGTPGGDAPNLLASGYTITAEIEVAQGGGNGMRATQGGRFAGWGFHLRRGKPVHRWNLLDLKRVRREGEEALMPGKHMLECDFAYDGMGMGTLAFDSTSGLGRGGEGVPRVDDRDYRPPFAFDGEIEQLTIEIDRPYLSPEDIEQLQATSAGGNRSSE